MTFIDLFHFPVSLLSLLPAFVVIVVVYAWLRRKGSECNGVWFVVNDL
jgi:hypothetical protein